MEPLEPLFEESIRCDWGYQNDLPNLEEMSSEFEEFIEIKEDDCGYRSLLMGDWIQMHAADEHVYHEMLVHPAFVTFTLMNGRPPKRIFLGGSGEGAGAR